MFVSIYLNVTLVGVDVHLSLRIGSLRIGDTMLLPWVYQIILQKQARMKFWCASTPIQKGSSKILEKKQTSSYSGHSKSQPTCTLPFRIPIDLGHYLSLDDVGSFVQEHWTKDHPITILLRVRRFGAEKHLSANGYKWDSWTFFSWARPISPDG